MELIEKFYQFESEYDLNKFIIDGLWYYPLIKMTIYFELAGQNLKNNKNKRNKSIYSNVFKQFLKAMYWKINSERLHFSKYLFVDSALTRRQGEDGVDENMYFDPIINKLGYKNSLFVEYPNNEFNHTAKISHYNIYFPDFDIFKIFLKARFRKKKLIVNKKPVQDLYDYFEVHFDPDFINDRLNKFFLFKNLFEKMLNKVRPEIILLVDGYDYKQMALIYAAKKLGIPTVEMQHGLISRTHMGYMYKNIVSHQLFADYLFTFGDFFTRLIQSHSMVWQNNHIVSTGFPYIEMIKQKPVRLPTRLVRLANRFKIIYVTSQWTVRDELKKFIIELAKKLDPDFMIFYKIHPGEKEIENFYKPFLRYKNIELISDKSINSLELMKVAFVHSTVYSTSYFESVFFELPNIFIDVPQYRENIQNFIDNETAFLAIDTSSYFQYLEKILANSNISKKLQSKRVKFYSPNSLENVMASIERIAHSTKT